MECKKCSLKGGGGGGTQQVLPCLERGGGCKKFRTSDFRIL